MTVKELVNNLERFDENMDVNMVCDTSDGFNLVFPIKDVEIHPYIAGEYLRIIPDTDG